MFNCHLRPERVHQLPFFPIRIVHDFRFVAEDHGGAFRRIERGPRRQTFMVGIAGPRKVTPGHAHFVLKRVSSFAFAGHAFGLIDIFLMERDLERVESLELALPNGRLPREVIHIHGGLCAALRSASMTAPLRKLSDAMTRL